jgi:cytochrome P450
MSSTLAPMDDVTTLDQLHVDPYPIYTRMRAHTPVVRVNSARRTFLTKAADCRAVKEDTQTFSSDDPNTPMKIAFEAHTLMRKDGEDHKRERDAMMPALGPKPIMQIWQPLYRDIAAEYLDRLPRDGIIDLHTDLAEPVASRILAHILGIPAATDAEMARWSQILIDGAGNFGWRDAPFAACKVVNAEMNALFVQEAERCRAAPDMSAMSVMVNADDPIAWSQITANIKIAIGGGINEPRDALSTIVYGLLTNPDQLAALKDSGDWGAAFEEGVRWCAPIQASSRLVTQDTEISGYHIPKGDTVMSIQASANWDEDVYDAPERFDVFRKVTTHQSFGFGPHHCAGAHVSRRTVGAVMLPMLFERFPGMTLPDPSVVKWRGFGFRGPINLPVRLNG